jgi:two-component system chemotaxis response regulator CheY
MDRNMPEMDGITCIREIMKADPEAKILIVSGYEDSGSEEIAEDVKKLIKGYITKPCGREELGRTLSQVLQI